jgi:hypothetical protein
MNEERNGSEVSSAATTIRAAFTDVDGRAAASSPGVESVGEWTVELG